MAFVSGICADASVAPDGTPRDKAGKSAMSHHPAETFEDRRSRADYSAEGLGVLLRSISLRRYLPASGGEYPAVAAIALLREVAVAGISLPETEAESFVWERVS